MRLRVRANAVTIERCERPPQSQTRIYSSPDRARSRQCADSAAAWACKRAVGSTAHDGRGITGGAARSGGLHMPVLSGYPARAGAPPVLLGQLLPRMPAADDRRRARVVPDVPPPDACGRCEEAAGKQAGGVGDRQVPAAGLASPSSRGAERSRRGRRGGGQRGGCERGRHAAATAAAAAARVVVGGGGRQSSAVSRGLRTDVGARAEGVVTHDRREQRALHREV
jgi:hypothetical protein